ncbi:unnamed protein product [Aspergillus oryzae var. brunneus]|uniref:Unnamed protein product n=2 Tax=Aspergillus oryzae TaxID=5062 RepID=A0AAN4YSQ9_ASPOZ|nr:unnamed protein product [Aspergillus oryzae]GMG33392.1 unnamed protein product [Aspergillus oryzae]GMG41124.1 unnamed protein product [Aspergillus oryzae var. brunneus]
MHAAIIDVDGNSIEAVYRPSSSSARSEVSRSALALLENGSVVSKTAPSIVSKATSKASSVKPESVASPRSEARSYVSKATTAVERAAPSVISREVQPAPSPTYVVHHTTQKTDDGMAAKTIVGTLIGAAAGAAIAYAMSKGDSEPSETTPPPQYTPRDLAQLISPSQAQSPSQELQGFRAIEAPPARGVYSHSEVRPTLTRSVTSKNPRASTIYEGSEFVPRGGGGSVYLDQNGRRSSEGSVYSGSDYPIRAIEYPPSVDSRGYEATLISSFHDKSRAMDNGSVYSSSTIRPSKANYQDHHSSHSSHHSSHHSSRHSSRHSIARSHSSSTVSATRSACNVPLPEGSIASFASSRSGAKSGVSARNIPLPESVYDDVDVETNVTPDDSISQVDDSRRSSVSHRSHVSKAASRISKHSSKFDEPVKPSDSVSQVSSHASRASQRTIKAGGSVAGGSKAPSKVSSRRGSQVA